ncbi:hypothetical protein VTI74DRAFT_11639 [Chaetomium olivicolor]
MHPREDLLGGGPDPALQHAPQGTVVVDDMDIASGATGAAPPQQHETKRRRMENRNGNVEADRTIAELPGRRCFVTIGATAGFRSLLEEVSTPAFLSCLAGHGYTDLRVQCGPDLAFFADRVAALKDEERHGVAVVSFAYTDEMTANIVACRGEDGVRPAGCVIAHGGTGTVGEVLAVGAPLIVVANPTLMDNHQLELAESLEEQGQAIHGRIGHLPDAVEHIAQRIIQGTLDALPPYSPPPFPVPAAERVTLFDWMVLTCYPEELARQQHLADLAAADANFAAEQQQHAASGGTTAATTNQGENNGMLQLD